MRKKIFWLSGVLYFLFSVLCPKIYANNICVSNLALTKPSTQNKTCRVQFNLSWENSWRNARNYDAAWVFMKYSSDGGSTWHHAYLKTAGVNPADCSRGTGTNIDIKVPLDNKAGAFIRRSGAGAGNLAVSNIQLNWDWQRNGLNINSTARIKVFAVEMVYVPSGEYTIGDGASDAQQFSATKIKTADATIAGSGWPGSPPHNNSKYPNGFNGFYLMKTEITQGQYRDFLNCLTLLQQRTRSSAWSPGKFTGDGDQVPIGQIKDRNSEPGNGGGIMLLSQSETNPAVFICNLGQDLNPANNGETFSCNHLGFADIAAYADWSGLRPLTEFEFEKAIRGPLDPTQNEYVWGGLASVSNTKYVGSPVFGSNVTFREKGIGLVNGVCIDPNWGAGKAGACATSNSVMRAQAGAGYYGNLDLAGNLADTVVSTYYNFDGTHGDGELVSDSGDGGLHSVGDSNIGDVWPPHNTAAVYSGIICRGGCYWSSLANFRISSRGDGFRGRTWTNGGRCARTDTDPDI